MSMVVGVDSSTQSTKVLLCRAEDGSVVLERSAPHPEGTECPPQAWWEALQTAGEGLLEQAEGVAVAAQQHGMVALDAAGEVVRPALLWNDTRSAPQAAALVASLGGARQWALSTGSVPTMSFTITKLAWMAAHEPANARATEQVLLPHDWLTWRLSDAEPVTDRGDASGTGYYSPAAGAWQPDLAEAALGHAVALPRVAGSAEATGTTPWGAVLGPGTGDNMGAALGLGLTEGDIVVSIGTSGTAYAVTTVPAADTSGAVAGFADATGRFLPLVATVNAARVLTATASILNTDAATVSRLALAAAPGAGGLTLLPYLDGERTPNRPGANGVLRGLTSSNATPENMARAAVEAVLCSLADAIDCLVSRALSPARPARVVLIGGGARSEAIRRLAPAIFGVPVSVPRPAEYVALGAARQAAWVLSGASEPPQWPAPPAETFTAPAQPDVRAQYAMLREDAAAWQLGRTVS